MNRFKDSQYKLQLNSIRIVADYKDETLSKKQINLTNNSFKLSALTAIIFYTLL